MKANLLLVDDDADLLATLAKFLASDGARVRVASSCAAALARCDEEQPDVCVVDYELPDGTAFDVLDALKKREPRPSVIVLTGHGSIELAVQAIKRGADHFLTKPVDLPSLGVLVDRLIRAGAEQRRGSATARSEERARVDPFIGKSDAIRRVCEESKAVAASEVSVLLTGETGTGKGVLARWLHERGVRAAEAFVDLNCAGLSRELTESELFGHQRGSFTGAHTTKRGLLEIAHHGTLFLDEIADLDPAVQPKLLKALEDRSFRRIGDVQKRVTDFRLISATHRDLPEMTATSAFRADLFFRLNTVTIQLPALRERRDDIAPLAKMVLAKLCRQHGRGSVELTPAALEAMRTYRWPGNLRELHNALERALIFSRSQTIDRRDLALGQHSSQPAEPTDGDTSLTLKQMERRHVLAVMQRVDGHVDEAAKLLGVARSSLYARLKRYGLTAS